MATQYRDTRAGSTLVDALDELVTDGRLPGDLAVKVLEEFDAVFLNALTTKVTDRATFKARLDTYRFCDNVWTFVISGTEFKVTAGGGVAGGGGAGGGGGDEGLPPPPPPPPSSKPTVLPTPGKIKLVCVDSKVVDGPDGGGGGAGGGAAV